jgi:FAD dependent oxidoreductase TIGR03364
MGRMVADEKNGFDLLVVGGGIVGMAHALAGARRGLSVALFERDGRANGASIRNFGFVTVTGQRAGRPWQRARYSRDVWEQILPDAGIPVIHRDLTVVARRPEALTVLEQFAAGEMGRNCRILDRAALRQALPMAAEDAVGGLFSPHERRIESRNAVPALANWLEARHKVTFFRGVAVHAVESGHIDSTAGRFAAPLIAVCPGADLVSLFPDRMRAHHLTLCKLQMMRLAAPGWRLPNAVMGDLSLVRYEGYLPMAGVPALKARLTQEAGDALEQGIHVIVVQSADGSLVVGDSHHYAATPDPFASSLVDDIILRETRALLRMPADLPVVERWVGFYPSSAEHQAILDQPERGILLCQVSSGTGMSTGFALGEEGLAMLLGEPDPLASSGA